MKILVSCFHRGCVCSSSEKGGEGSGGGITGNKRVSFLYFPSPSIAVSIGGEETKVYIRLAHRGLRLEDRETEKISLALKNPASGQVK